MGFNLRMANRIPPSLKWLIVKRARLDGEIKKTEAALKRSQRLLEELSVIKADLAAIDRALGLHDLQVDIDLIQPIRSQYVRTAIPHGEITRSALLCLRLNEGGPVSTDTIANFISTRFADLKATPQDATQFRNSVRHRLKVLARQQIVHRHHPKIGSAIGFWSLADFNQESTEDHHVLSEVDDPGCTPEKS
ncbi:MAG: hypothetical protein NVSMB6_03360 [Burkholderiaceae bacterium]